MEELRRLLSRLGIEEYLVITDEITGAGYIAKNDLVFARWGHILEGIALMSTYIQATSRKQVTEAELYGYHAEHGCSRSA